MWRIVIFVSKHLVMTVNRGLRGRESNEVCNRDSGSSHDHSVCVIPKLPAIHTWAVEREEERIAEAELAEQKITNE